MNGKENVGPMKEGEDGFIEAMVQGKVYKTEYSNLLLTIKRKPAVADSMKKPAAAKMEDSSADEQEEEEDEAMEDEDREVEEEEEEEEEDEDREVEVEEDEEEKEEEEEEEKDEEEKTEEVKTETATVGKPSKTSPVKDAETLWPADKLQQDCMVQPPCSSNEH